MMRTRITVTLTIVFVLFLLTGCVKTDILPDLKGKQITYVSVLDGNRYESFYADGIGHVIGFSESSRNDTKSFKEYPVTVEFLGDYINVNYYDRYTLEPKHILIDKVNVIIHYVDGLSENGAPIESSQNENSVTSIPSESSSQSSEIADESQILDNSSASEVSGNNYTIDVYNDYMTVSIPISRTDIAIGLSQEQLNEEKRIADEAKMQYTINRTVEAYCGYSSDISIKWTQEGDNLLFTLTGTSEIISEVVYSIKSQGTNLFYLYYNVQHGTEYDRNSIYIYFSSDHLDRGVGSAIYCSMVDHR